MNSKVEPLDLYQNPSHKLRLVEPISKNNGIFDIHSFFSGERGKQHNINDDKVERFFHVLTTVLKHSPNSEVDLVTEPDFFSDVDTYKAQDWKKLEETLMGAKQVLMHVHINIRILNDTDLNGIMNISTYSIELIEQGREYILNSVKPIPIFPKYCDVRSISSEQGIERLLSRYQQIIKAQQALNAYPLTDYEYVQSGLYLTQWISAFLLAEKNMIIALSDVGETNLQALYSQGNYPSFIHDTRLKLESGQPFQLSIITKPVSFSDVFLLLPVVIHGSSVRAMEEHEYTNKLNVNFIYGDATDVFIGLKALHTIYSNTSH